MDFLKQGYYFKGTKHGYKDWKTLLSKQNTLDKLKKIPHSNCRNVLENEKKKTYLAEIHSKLDY